MKTKSDPRHQKRREIVKSLFSYSFHKKQARDKVVTEILANTEILDKQITLSAPEWPLLRINKIDLAILRLAVFELLVKKTEPVKVVIDEAVELAKEFGSENSASFINGALGNILKKNADE